VYKNRWFVLAQTEGEALPEFTFPAWDKDRARAALGVTEISFDLLNGNCMGFARDQAIAINPINPLPYKTRFHELAHVLLGHTAEVAQQDGEHTPRSLDARFDRAKRRGFPGSRSPRCKILAARSRSPTPKNCLTIKFPGD
jgi:hypothetical protein